MDSKGLKSIIDRLIFYNKINRLVDEQIENGLFICLRFIVKKIFKIIHKRKSLMLAPNQRYLEALHMQIVRLKW